MELHPEIIIDGQAHTNTPSHAAGWPLSRSKWSACTAQRQVQPGDEWMNGIVVRSNNAGLGWDPGRDRIAIASRAVNYFKLILLLLAWSVRRWWWWWCCSWTSISRGCYSYGICRYICQYYYNLVIMMIIYCRVDHENRWSGPVSDNQDTDYTQI